MSVVSNVSGSMFTRYSFLKLLELLSTVPLMNMPCNCATDNLHIYMVHELHWAELTAKTQTQRDRMLMVTHDLVRVPQTWKDERVMNALTQQINLTWIRAEMQEAGCISVDLSCCKPMLRCAIQAHHLNCMVRACFR